MQLRWRLASALLILLLVLAAAIAWVGRYASELYFQEVNQTLNASLAMYVVDRLTLIEDGSVNKDALKALAEQAMTVNPSVEVYLLDAQGQIVDHGLPPGSVELGHVDLRPLQQFLQGDGQLILGDDPRLPGVKKAFSTSPIFHDGALQGYLYVVLGGAKFDAVQQAFLGTFIGRMALVSLLVVVAVGVLIGYNIVSRVTSPIEQLDRAVAAYVKSDFEEAHLEDVKEDSLEIKRLKHSLEVLVSKLSQQFEQLETNARLRRELLANVSHDLRTPLASMQGYVETLLIKDGRLTQQERRHYLNIAHAHTKRLNHLVVDLFELAKLDSGVLMPKDESFALSDLLNDVVQEFSLAAKEKGVGLQMSLPQDSFSAMVVADIGLIQRVFENLISNALRYTPAGGDIVIKISHNSQEIGVQVQDSGCGIKEELLPTIFDRYAQGDHQDTQGSGLGLAIVKRILELHGSNIVVQSKVDVGTQFNFALKAA